MLKAGEPTLAESLAETARLTEGPFYPDRLPLDTDNDLLIINESITPAVGEITHLSGRVLTASGSPVSNVTVEIWQVDANAVYLHSRSAGAGHRDSHFQGFGRFLTDSKGRYYFRTVKPVPYPGRTPHIHVAVNRGDRRLLTTQLLIAGHPGNARDGVFRRLQDPVARKSVLANFERVAESKIVEWATTFDIVLNRTAFEDDAGQLRS
ncbi:MAG: protocatechuate 3,4-dioxygenase [Planctomycetota bacterium]